MSLTDIDDLVARIRGRGARSVTLQFPDGLKRRAPAIASALREAGISVIISGDPCYGACDLALDMLRWTDLLVHFGHTPLSTREDVLYEPFLMDFDPERLAGALPLIGGKTVGLVTTTQHSGMIPAITGYFEGHGITLLTAEGGPRTAFCGQVLGCSYVAARQVAAHEILFVGTGLFHPRGVQLATGKRVVAVDPYTGEASVVDGERFLRRRFALIERAREADTFGILLSTKTGQARHDLAERLATLSDRAAVVAMREVSPEGLLDLGFSCYVNTACPRLAYDDQVRFPVPVLSPQEFEILCGVRSFDEYAIDEMT
ncbi:MAG: diphthamide biosynthesis enzyme Dph2 [Methanoregulaceae archaeon]|nr:diphthamide biosynthesis enzyme Dph2 [Methanoregulaceae archaeon]